VQKLATNNGEAMSDSRDSFHDEGSGSDADAGTEKSQHVGPTSNMSLLDQHSKLKLEALGSLLLHLSGKPELTAGSLPPPVPEQNPEPLG